MCSYDLLPRGSSLTFQRALPCLIYNKNVTLHIIMDVAFAGTSRRSAQCVLPAQKPLVRPRVGQLEAAGSGSQL